MGNMMLAEVQSALIDATLLQVHQASQISKPQALSPLLTDYLDTLLQSATEIPEARLQQFACLHFAAADAEFYVPLSRLSRIDYAAGFRRHFSFEIPDYACSGRFMFQVQPDQGWLFFDELLGLENICSEDVVWRAAAHRAPWFIGTHKRYLRRIFDPKVLMERQQKTG